MIFMAFFTRLEARLDFSKGPRSNYPLQEGQLWRCGPRKRAKVQPPPLRGSDGLFKPSKVHVGEAP